MSGLAPDEIYCPACGVVIHESTNFCPECGAENDAFHGGAPQDPPPSQDPPPGGTPGGPQSAPAGGGGGTATPNGRAGGGYQRLIDRDWPLLSQSQALAGAKSGVYAAIIGISATMAWTALSALSVLTGNVGDPGGGTGGVGGGGPAAGEAANVAAGLIEIAQSGVTVLVKFLVWLFYSANFVPMTVDTGARSTEFDLLSSLSWLGVSPMIYRVTVVALLLAFGYRAAASWGYGSYPEAAGAGATVAIGYLLILVPGALLVGFSAGGQFGSSALSVGPSVAMTVAIPGAMAALCGAGGGLLREYARQS